MLINFLIRRGVDFFREGVKAFMRLGEFKCEVLRINNKANMEVFKQGLLEQHINIFRNEVVIIAKNRRGETTMIPLQWLPEFTAFSSLERNYEEPD